jgi:hypothetical protein
MDAASTCGPYVAPNCGAGSDGGLLYCDLRTNTCCLTLSLVGRCLPNGGTCTKSEVTVGCSNACDCTGGEVCCGVENGIAATTSCQSVSSGGKCPAPAGSGAAQFCTVDSECLNGAGCIPQTCTFGANLNICGLQSQSPFNCTVRDAGP